MPLSYVIVDWYVSLHVRICHGSVHFHTILASRRGRKKKCTMNPIRGHDYHKGNLKNGYATTPVPQYYVLIVEQSWCHNHSYGSLGVIDAPNSVISTRSIVFWMFWYNLYKNSFSKKKRMTDRLKCHICKNNSWLALEHACDGNYFFEVKYNYYVDICNGIARKGRHPHTKFCKMMNKNAYPYKWN